jgi:hypothetical protein
MRQDSSQFDGSVALESAPVAGASAVARDTAVAVGGLASLRRRTPLVRARVTTGPRAVRGALATLIVGAFAVVILASSGPNVLVPRSTTSFPHWESGVLHGLFGRWITGAHALGLVFSVVLVAMLGAYGVLLSSVRTISARAIVICVVALHAILLMSPPLQLTDVFNYLGYARLGGLHGLNPYTHVIAQELHDPVFRFSTWHHLHSPYGPLFTAGSYLVAAASVPLAYWVLKLVTVLASLAFIGLVWQCARQLGRDPRFAVLFVAANPIYLMYAVAGFHNDFFMLIPATAAISLLLAGRERASGAVLMLAVAVKFTAILLLPFLLIGTRPARRRLRLVLGAVLGAVPLIALSIALFGLSIPNLQDQSTLLTDFSIPNLFGLAIGIGGGTPGLLRVANVALVLTVALLLRRRGDWLSGAGWATLALIASLAWLVPWYVIWVLPLAALGSSIRLRRAALAMTAYLVVAFMPATGMFLSAHHLNPMGSSVGQASKALQYKLEH